MIGTSIATAIAGARAYLTEHPDEARYRDSAAAAVIEDGLRVRVTGADGASVTTDMVTGIGGGGSAPSPGWLARAAYASCVATVVAMRAAEEGVRLDSLTVTVDSESDDRGILGMDPGIPAGPLGIGVVIELRATGVAEDRLQAIAEWGWSHCPVDDLARRAVPVDVRVTVGSPGGV